MVFSVHHTGTVFLLDLIQWHSEVTALREMGEMVKTGSPPAEPGHLIHLHLMGYRADSRGPLDITWDAIVDAVNRGRVAIPLRDPMLALISRERRLPGADHRFIVDGFRALTELKPKAWLRVDNDWTEYQRRAALNETLASIGLAPEPFTRRLAREWKPKNTWDDREGVSRLHRLYAIGDLEGLRAAFPLNYDHLLAHAGELIPFLQARGYRSLRWWGPMGA